MSKLRIVKNRRYIDSRDISHSFALIYNYDTEAYFYRYKWCRDVLERGRGDYGERSYASYMFNNFNQFIQIMIKDNNLQDLYFNFSLEDIHYEEFITIEDMEI